MDEAQEKKDFLAMKIKELQELVYTEDMSVLKTLEFKVKRKKTAKKKEDANEGGDDEQVRADSEERSD